MNFEADGLKQQKTTLGSTPVNKEQKTEAIIHTSSIAAKSAPTMWCSQY